MPSPNEINFDDDARPVGIVGFDFGAVDREPEAEAGEDAARLRQETVMRTIGFLVSGARDAVTAGRRTLLIGYLLRADGAPKSQRELARIFGISAPRVNQTLTHLRKELSGLCRDDGTAP